MAEQTAWPSVPADSPLTLKFPNAKQGLRQKPPCLMDYILKQEPWIWSSILMNVSSLLFCFWGRYSHISHFWFLQTNPFTLKMHLINSGQSFVSLTNSKILCINMTKEEVALETSTFELDIWHALIGQTIILSLFFSLSFLTHKTDYH